MRKRRRAKIKLVREIFGGSQEVHVDVERDVIRILLQGRKRNGSSKSALKSQRFAGWVSFAYQLDRLPSHDPVAVTDAVDSMAPRTVLERTTLAANNNDESLNSLMLRHARMVN